ncbi:3033_t:CDS:2 [Cetraspora pellucida]|uniref:Protein transport protein SEC22 n=1 Tax=Cetraspora pellucida TaxID=1433469 RepID=A0A9N9H1D9_9GLOM|nr:3033_t:CDS:2 [Cetraspora pellucida]
MNENSEERCSIESGSYYFHYLIQNGVCYMTICDRSYPRQFAFSYLEELSKEFLMSYGNEPFEALRIYVIYVFGLEILTMLTTNAYARLNTELNEVANIMTKNLESVLWRGEGLESKCCLLIQTMIDYYLEF